MKIKKILFLIAFAVFLPSITLAAYSYTPMEAIPGFGKPTGFQAYISAVYKFGLWTIGISALLMITLGGYMYLTSAGNTSQTGKAKGVITDAIIGVIMALVSWLLLYTINPDLVDFSAISSTTSSSTTSSGTTASGTATSATGAGATTNTATTSATSSDCSQINDAVNNNSSGVDPSVLKAIMVGGEGCNKSVSSDGYGSCGYSQALPKIRTWCGISGTAQETCQAIQNDPQLDANCAAKLIADNSKRCGTDIENVASCYNSGKANNCAHTTNNYCDRVSTYYQKQSS